ncbi:MAG: hypothetical protein ACYCT2_08165 [Thermoplasmataceae archaeon]
MRKVFVVMLAVIAVLAFSIPTAVYLHDYYQQSGNGPGIQLHVDFISGSVPSVASQFNPYNYSNVSAAVFSPVPGSLNSGSPHNLSDLNQTSNPYELRLFEGKANSQGVVLGYLDSNFFNISKQWQEYASTGTVNVSLSLLASYSYAKNGEFYVYTYYNNIPYNPFLQFTPELAHQFSSSIYFNLQTPSEVIPLNSTNMTQSDVTIGGSGESCNTQYTTVYDRTITAPMPLMAASLSLPSNSELTYGFYQLSGPREFSFNSVSKNTLQRYVEASTSPSWDGTESGFSATSASSNALPRSNENVSTIYIPGVSIHIVSTDILYEYTDGANCSYVNGGTTTTVSLTGISSNFDPHLTFMSNVANSTYWYAVFNAMGMIRTSNVTLSPGQTASSQQFFADASGYTSAVDAESIGVNAAPVMVASLGVELAIGTAAEVIPGANSAAEAVDLVNDALSGASLTLAIMSAFSSISYLTGMSMTYGSINVGNAAMPGTSGNSLTVNTYQASTQSEIIVSGSVYTMNMPMAYIVGMP